MLQLKYEAFGRELLVLRKIREEFIQEVSNGYLFDQPGMQDTQWMSPVLNSFLAYMYYCGSVNPHHKSHMMNVPLDDPQTYKETDLSMKDWHSWADKQEIPGLWGRLPDHPAEYQTAMFEATKAKIALEPIMESSGECSEMWCKGIINMMVQIRQEIKDRSAANQSESDIAKSSVDVLGNDTYDKTVKKGRGRPKGVLNSTVIELQSLARSPIKLCSKNSAKSSWSLHDDANSKRSNPEVVEEMRDVIQVPKLQRVQLDTSSAFKRVNKEVAALDHRNFKLDQSSLNQTTFRTSSNSPKKNIQTSAENDVPALDLSTLFFRKLQPSNSKKSLLLLAPTKRLSTVLDQKSANQEQMQSDMAETSKSAMLKSQSDQHVPSQSSHAFISFDDPPSFSDYTEPWVYSSDIYMAPNEESESSLYDEATDQVLDANTSFKNILLSKPTCFSSEVSKDEDVGFSSSAASLNCSEEFNHPTSTPSGSSPLSEDDLQMQTTSSPLLPIMEHEESPFISSLSLSDQEESAQPPAITSKTSKGTLIFTKSLDDKFVYDSVIFVPNLLKSKSKGKGKGKSKGKSNCGSESVQSFQKNHEIPKLMQMKLISQIQTDVLDKNDKSQKPPEEKKKGKRKAVTLDESPTDHSGSGTKSMTTLTLPANMSKVAKACQKAQASSNSESLMWNEKFLKFFSCLGQEWTQSDELQSNIKQQISKAMASKDVQKQIKTHMHIIVQQKGMVKLPEESKIGFKVLFTLLEMKGQ
ncbi:hypothetical protein EV702DRAFT_1048912 [Suillus placidus]|uniref:Uncharacterized protein n=1 Tax=Suillus placidus TaxID=48579 RepID=A0A9P6ZMI8_9AGAM|nr:hypothetical protein EV702DRAFT_1048912 [Suillus placidus]